MCIFSKLVVSLSQWLDFFQPNFAAKGNAGGGGRIWFCFTNLDKTNTGWRESETHRYLQWEINRAIWQMNRSSTVSQVRAVQWACNVNVPLGILSERLLNYSPQIAIDVHDNPPPRTTSSIRSFLVACRVAVNVPPHSYALIAFSAQLRIFVIEKLCAKMII